MSAEFSLSRGPVLDDLDDAIVAALARDGRRPYGHIARELGVAEATVRYRVTRLRESGLLRILAVTDPVAAGKRIAQVHVRVSGSVRDVASRIAAAPEVEFVVITSGSADIICEVIARDDMHLLEVMEFIRALEGVAATESLIYLHMEKVGFGSVPLSGNEQL